MDFPPLLVSDLEQVESALELPSGFLDRLLDEDDWSFVIKAHALIEGAIWHLLSARLDSALQSFAASLSFASGRNSRLGLVQAYNLLDAPTIHFIRDLGELRNRLAHDVRETGFTFRTYIDGLSPSEARAVARKYTRVFDLTGEWELEEARAELVRLGPRQVMHLAVVATVSRAYYAAHPDQLDAALDELGRVRPELFVLALLVIIAVVTYSTNGDSSAGRTDVTSSMVIKREDG